MLLAAETSLVYWICLGQKFFLLSFPLPELVYVDAYAQAIMPQLPCPHDVDIL